MTHWDNEAIRCGTDPTWDDHFMVEFEIKAIGQFISETDSVLDMGCGNGYSLELQKGYFKGGIDYSEKMIEQAKKREAYSLWFDTGDIRKIASCDESFDVVYTTRCLINLPTWEDQMQGIKECIRVASKRVIFCEAFYEPFIKLNALRTIAGLPPLVEHDFNRYIKKSRMEELLGKFTCVDFSSVYYLGSRFIRELTSIPDTSYSNEINEIFYDLQHIYPAEGFGIQQIYVYDKAAAIRDI